MTHTSKRSGALIGQPMTLSRVLIARHTAGEQTEEILREFGIGASKVEGLRKGGVA